MYKPVMSTKERVVYLGLIIIGFALTTIFFIWWMNPEHIPNNFSGYLHVFDYLLFILVTYVVWYQIVNECFSWFIAGFMKEPVYVAPKKGLKVAFVTAFVPGNEPYDILERTLRAMVDADYPHDTWLLDEGNDSGAKLICKRIGVKHFSRKGVQKYNTPEGPYKVKTKGGNYNAWLDKFGKQYEIVAQLDVDFVPKKNYLTQTLGYFRDPNVAFVGTPQVYGNINSSWIAHGAAQQAYNFYGSMQKGLFGSDMSLFIGANHVLRVAAHDDVDGYSGHIVEDHLTGMHFYAKKWKSIYLGKTLAVGEGPSTWNAYFSQQMRWAYGLIDILFHHSPTVFRKMKKMHQFNYFILQQYYFFGVAQVIGIFLLCLYFFFGFTILSMSLSTLLVMYVSLLLFQQVFFVWLQRFNIDPSTEKGFMLTAKILNMAAWPIYFLAFVGVIRKKRLSYVVTPKGSRQETTSALSLFTPHFILGSLTFFCLIAASITENRAPQLVFWAIINTVVMYTFVCIELIKKLKQLVEPLLKYNLRKGMSLAK